MEEIWSRRTFQSVLGSHYLISTINCCWNLKCGWFIFVSVNNEKSKKIEYRVQGSFVSRKKENNKVFKFQDLLYRRFKKHFPSLLFFLFVFFFVSLPKWGCKPNLAGRGFRQLMLCGKAWPGAAYTEPLGIYGDHLHHCNVATRPLPFWAAELSKCAGNELRKCTCAIFFPPHCPFSDSCCVSAALPCFPNVRPCSLFRCEQLTRWFYAHMCSHVHAKGLDKELCKPALCPNAIHFQIIKRSVKRCMSGRRQLAAVTLCKMVIVCPSISRDWAYAEWSRRSHWGASAVYSATACLSPPSSSNGYADSLSVFQTCLDFHYVDMSLPARLGPQL